MIISKTTRTAIGFFLVSAGILKGVEVKDSLRAEENCPASNSSSPILIVPVQMPKAIALELSKQEDNELLVIRGYVTRDKKGEFFPFYRIPKTPHGIHLAEELPHEGTHEIRFLNKAGEILKQIAWTPIFGNDDSGKEFLSQPFIFCDIPLEGVHTVELRTSDKIMATLKVLELSPVVKDLHQEKTQIVDSENKKQEIIQLSWTALHPLLSVDEARQKLVHQIFCSADGGKTWGLVKSGLKEPRSEINVKGLPSGLCIFMIKTTDGYNVASVTGAPIDTGKRAVLAQIIAPKTGITYREGAGVLLIGRGYDYDQKGPVSSDRLVWQSDIQQDKSLGTGEKLVVRNLKPGTHHITLHVKDGDGTDKENEPPEIVVTVTPKEN